jgi:hypothetical protein
VINTEQFNWRSVGRKLIDDERRDPIAQRGQVLVPVA